MPIISRLSRLGDKCAKLRIPTSILPGANYQKIGELIKWLDDFAPDAVPFQDYRYWGAFYCLGLP
jgi:hypothetical protein